MVTVLHQFDSKTTFEIDFQIINDLPSKNTRTTVAMMAHGYVNGDHKFNGVANYDKNTDEFIDITNIRDIFDRDWIIQNSLEIIPQHDPGVLTVRALHYKLVSRGMINHMKLYKRVVSAMIHARWEGLVPFEAFSDHDREMIGETRYERTDVEESIELAKEEIQNWMKYYNKNRWENQPYYVEVFIEKKALQGVFTRVCRQNRVAFGACKGYPSLTFLNDAGDRFLDAESAGKKPVILYFGDYDPSGEDIPRSIEENLNRMGVDIQVERVALMEDQVVEWDLPPAPAKSGDSRTANWDGLGQVELDAVDDKKLVSLCQDAIDEFFDEDLHEELMETEETEREQYRQELRDFVNNFNPDE